jgi:hypothetical protein
VCVCVVGKQRWAGGGGDLETAAPGKQTNPFFQGITNVFAYKRSNVAVTPVTFA